jgi:glycosyltransferase involved in cell wall biosynthesis
MKTMDSSNPLVSIIITCYNYGNYLSKAIDSALAQTYQNKEIIVIDDGSTDNTGLISRSYGKQINYKKQKNLGVSAARNLGMKICNGEFINFLDADDYLCSNKISIQMDRFKNDPLLDVVASGRYDVDENGKIDGIVILKWGTNALDHLLKNGCFTSNSALVRREALERVGGFYDKNICESWPEDTDLWIRLAGTGSQFYIEKKPLCFWRHHNITISRSEKIDVSYIGFYKMISRLEKLQLKHINKKQWKTFQALVHMSFCSRYYLRSRLNESKKIIKKLNTNYREIFLNPSSQLELYLRSLKPGSKISYREFSLNYIDKMLPKLICDLPKNDRKSILATAWLAASDLSYSDFDTKSRYRAIYNALISSFTDCFSSKCLPSVIRSILGPNTGRIISKMLSKY